MTEVQSFCETSYLSRVSRVPAHNELSSVCCNDLTVVTGRVERSAVDCNKSHDCGFSIFGQSKLSASFTLIGNN